ncbi:MAG: hypothetical protein KDB02_07165 [Acidimicrobiales bacterium]|nr:hypothetical protein [Acidimicrobiales bacterium]
MRRPHVGLENFERVYEYYRHHEQSMAFARFAGAVLARIYRPDITCDDGAEDAIADALAAGNRVVISPNHTTADDQYVIVALAQKLPALRSVRGRAFIPAEPSLFGRSGVPGKILRRSVDGLGALPTFRLEDLRRRGIEITDEVRHRYEQAILRASETQVAKLVAGHSMAGFWEGTRNRIRYAEVQPLRKGIAHTAIAASEHVGVVVLPVGFSYGGEPDDYQRPVLPGRHQPKVHVAHPIPVTTADPDKLVELVHPEIQRCVDIVMARSA